jgi:superfamily II DNA or RNA helicase
MFKTPLSNEFKERLGFLTTDPLDTYSRAPDRIREDFGTEEVTLAGGYAYRQIIELVQNGADAIWESYDDNKNNIEGRIDVLLTNTHLYVVNTGAPLSRDGLNALLRANSSPKRGVEIGRFGLGFKSLLRLGGKIEIFSRTNGNIYFDPERCRKQIHETFGTDIERSPGLRLAWAINANNQNHDSYLEEFGEWGETLIKAELKNDTALNALKDEMRKFRQEFLLFLPVPVKIKFIDTTEEKEFSRTMEVKNERNNQKRLISGENESLWYYFSMEAHIDDPVALEDATHIHGRDIIPIAWAYPVEGRNQNTGHFWAFFHTESDSRIAGILNAPWKLNADRTGIVPGPWNRALFSKSVDLIIYNLKNLYNESDPGSIFNAFPRQIESQDEIAKPLIDELWNKLIVSNVLPNGNKKLKKPTELIRYPTDDANLIQEWNNIASENLKNDYAHPSCFENRERISRFEECLKRIHKDEHGNNLAATDYNTWIESIADTDFKQSKNVLIFANVCKNKLKGEDWDNIKNDLHIIPSSDKSKLLSAKEAVISIGEVPTDRNPILKELIEDSQIKAILKDLGVKEPEDSLWYETLQNLLPNNDDNEKWVLFWQNLRMCPDNVSNDFIKNNKNNILVKLRGGQWRKRSFALLPDGWIDHNNSEEQNLKWLINKEYHSNDTELLSKLGVKSKYSGEFKLSLRDNVSFRKWRRKYHFSENFPENGAAKVIDDDAKIDCPKSLAWLSTLSGVSKCRATQTAFETINSFPQNYTSEIEVPYTKIGPQGGLYHNQRMKLENPVFWFLRENGLLNIGGELISIITILARKEKAGIKILPDWNKLSKILEKISISPYQIDNNQIISLWAGIVNETVTQNNIYDSDLLPLWQDSAVDNYIPRKLPSGLNNEIMPITEIRVTDSYEFQEFAKRNNVNVILLDSDTMRKWVEAGAHDISQEFNIEKIKIGEQTDVRDVIPELSSILDKTYYPCRIADSIIQRFMNQTKDLICLSNNGELILSKELIDLPLTEKLDNVISEMLGLGWCNGSNINEIKNKIIDTNVITARQRVRGNDNDTLPNRLFRAVGTENLVNLLTEYTGDKTVYTRMTDESISELALLQFGPSILSFIKPVLDSRGIKPPSRWNTEEAFRFVADIGFPLEYATSISTRREAEEIISGPIFLPPLHDFQEEVMDGISKLLPRDNFRRRAVVSLPTGGGKTRVMVQAAVEIVLKSSNSNKSVVWIAQTDELCEQAVEAFRQVWINIGAQNTDLRIVRLWGGQKNPEPQSLDIPLVVVASIQTLNNRFSGLEWLSSPGLVVLDECHHAITSSYTNMLRWLDVPARQSKEKKQEEPPIIGLSATPFRSNDEDSERLAKRFDNTWFPGNQPFLYQRLLDQKVLSIIKNEPLDSESKLTQDLIEILEKLEENDNLDKPAGYNFIQQIDEYFSKDNQRNELIINCVKQALENNKVSSVLLFANSVKHARLLSVLLNKAGVLSASIDGETPKNARRYFLNKFHNGEIKVLCNFSVLTTGFDAPKTDMILISRTIFSPVLYMQIVGRGLRGPKNGGTPECLLVTVNDNIGRFAEHYAYHYCQQYFDQFNQD